MNIHQSCRRRCQIRLLLQGPSGSGKTMSALLIAHGLAAGHWPKIVVIDSENGSAELYADLGAYNVLTLSPPYTPERYVQAIEACELAGMEVIIIDSMTHCWEYLLDYHAGLPGNSFTAWGKVTPRHTAFVNRILRSPAHVIATVRSKTEYVLSEKNGRQVPEKVGMKIIQREGIDYEFSVVLELDLRNNATASKDRTQLFREQPAFRPGQSTGESLRSWCEQGSPTKWEQIHQVIKKCQNLDEMASLYYSLSSAEQAEFRPAFQDQKQHLQAVALAPSSLGNNQLFIQPNPTLNHGNLTHSA
ncbi:AAA family ATPase [Hymenobacter lapidiphilus]|uniref:ATP-binding protein n=1 Tax=Hymenobacter sp. CCM 8763 TaxID=2303334 RepID=UPI000E349852|nr:ATP-binding protein [Hymenobacter sp. CCM 8763]RFP67083.1 AAA family ATPase [Hymenobacter sp. CCM 8763]